MYPFKNDVQLQLFIWTTWSVWITKQLHFFFIFTFERLLKFEALYRWKHLETNVVETNYYKTLRIWNKNHVHMISHSEFWLQDLRTAGIFQKIHPVGNCRWCWSLLIRWHNSNMNRNSVKTVQKKSWQSFKNHESTKRLSKFKKITIIFHQINFMKIKPQRF